MGKDNVFHSRNVNFDAFQNSGKKTALGFIGAPAFRQQDLDNGTNLVRDLINKNIAILSNYFFFTTKGTYNEVIRDPTASHDGWYPHWPNLKGFRLGPGKLGGLIELSALMEKIQIVSKVLDGPIKILIVLSLPWDNEDSYPEARALRRCAIRNNVIALTTPKAVNLWLNYEAVGGKVPDNRHQETLALISHDEMKLEMAHWVVKNSEKLKYFKRIVTTGTTGLWVKKFLTASGIPDDMIDSKYSGPEGGDVQISEEILHHKIQHVVFFIDPMTPHPHEVDIQALCSICTIPKIDVNLRLTEAAASSWINAYPL